MYIRRTKSVPFQCRVRMRSLAKTEASSTAFSNDKITTYSFAHCTYLFIMLQHIKLQYAHFLWHIKGASLANTDGYMTVMMGKGQYLPLNKEPSVHKYWSETQDQAAAHQIGCSFPSNSLKSKVLLLTPCQPRLLSPNEGCQCCGSKEGIISSLAPSPHGKLGGWLYFWHFPFKAEILLLMLPGVYRGNHISSTLSIPWDKFTPIELVTQTDTHLSIFFYEIDPRNVSFISQAWQKQLKGFPITLKVRADKAENPEIAYFTTLSPFQADLLPWKPKTPHQQLYLGK